MTPAGVSMQLLCQSQSDYANFQRAYYLDPAHATMIYSQECVPEQIIGLQRLIDSMAADIIKPQPIQFEILPPSNHG
jgi:hypothetical protein